MKSDDTCCIRFSHEVCLDLVTWRLDRVQPRRHPNLMLVDFRSFLCACRELIPMLVRNLIRSSSRKDLARLFLTVRRTCDQDTRQHFWHPLSYLQREPCISNLFLCVRRNVRNFNSKPADRGVKGPAAATIMHTWLLMTSLRMPWSLILQTHQSIHTRTLAVLILHVSDSRKGRTSAEGAHRRWEDQSHSHCQYSPVRFPHGLCQESADLLVSHWDHAGGNSKIVRWNPSGCTWSLLNSMRSCPSSKVCPSLAAKTAMMWRGRPNTKRLLR